MFDHMIAEAVLIECCANCRFSYIYPQTGEGWCKLGSNAFGALPKRIEEMDNCISWVAKEK